jgi:hypothetical protein
MVTRAARREAVAHLRVAYEVSERRACSALGADRTSVRYRVRTTRTYVRGSASWLPFDVGSGIGGCTSYSRAKASS